MHKTEVRYEYKAYVTWESTVGNVDVERTFNVLLLSYSFQCRKVFFSTIELSKFTVLSGGNVDRGIVRFKRQIIKYVKIHKALPFLPF